MVQGYPRSSCAPRSFLSAGCLWDLFLGCRSHLWSVMLTPAQAVWGGWDVSKAIWIPATLRSGAERPCHGKTPREELWHLPAAPALAVITPWLLLSGREELPQLLEMSQRGPAALSRGIPGLGTTRNGANPF